MYRKCTVDLVPKGVFRPPNAIGVNGEKQGHPTTKKPPKSLETPRVLKWLREPDLNRRPSGYEPDELPGCSSYLHQKKLISKTHGKNPVLILAQNHDNQI